MSWRELLTTARLPSSVLLLALLLPFAGCGEETNPPPGQGGEAGTGGTTSGSGGTTSGSGGVPGTGGSGATGGSASGGGCTTWFQDDLEHADVQAAISTGPWAQRDGDVTLSQNYAHSGTTSLRIAYAGNESQAYLGLVLNEGVDHFFCRWWELRERAGDFAGALDYDWSGEKFNRFRSADIGVDPIAGGLDYPLGWVADGGWGLPGTQGGGAIQLFGNSAASNGANHFSHVYMMPRGEWHMFELELKLGQPGGNDGETRLWIDDSLVVDGVGIQFRPTTQAQIEHIWIGGWYSGGADPQPSPAVRYVDDVAVSSCKIGF